MANLPTEKQLPPIEQVRRLAHEACRLIPDGPGCVMDERPYRGDCTYKNCGTMCALRDMLLRLSLCDTQSSEPKS